MIRRSLWSRRGAVGLTLFGIALSTALILGVERVRVETRENFTRTVAGTDLIVGARTSPVQLLLYSVFRLGDATASIRWSSFEKITRHPMVAWAVPISLGDSHRGYRVLGTTPGYFDHLQVGPERPLTFSSGGGFVGRFDAVIGAEVSRALGYELGDEIEVAHGARDDGLSHHDELPFAVTGILAPTGTPVDRTVHVTLEAIEAIHVGWESGVRVDGHTLGASEALDAADEALAPDEITAFFLSLRRKPDVFQMQRAINGFPDEPLLAILPGIALTELWGLFSTAELALVGVTVMTVVTGLIGMVVGILATLNERRREMAVLRAVGARPMDIAALLMAESTLIGALGALLGFALLSVAVIVANPLLAERIGIVFSTGLPSTREATLLGVVALLACLTGLLPAVRAYLMSVHDGLHAGA